MTEPKKANTPPARVEAESKATIGTPDTTPEALLSVDESLQALIAALGFTEEQISEIQVRANGKIRIFETDRGFNTRDMTPLKRASR